MSAPERPSADDVADDSLLGHLGRAVESARAAVHDEGVWCTSLDGHHHLRRIRWAWDCSVCGAVLNLGVWYSAEPEEHFDQDWEAQRARQAGYEPPLLNDGDDVPDGAL